MKMKPILFSGSMIQALLAGRKIQTRRIVKPQPIEYEEDTWYYWGSSWDVDRMPIGPGLHSPLEFYDKQVGDLLWVRETFCLESTYEYHDVKLAPCDRPYQIEKDYEGGESFVIPHYRATEPEPHIVPNDLEDGDDDRTRWKPSIFMPRWASRITLEITDIRVERLQDITRGDCMAEGCPFPNLAKETNPVKWYKELWESINGKDSWQTNPWVWVIEFKVHHKNILAFSNEERAAA